MPSEIQNLVNHPEEETTSVVNNKVATSNMKKKFAFLGSFGVFLVILGLVVVFGILIPAQAVLLSVNDVKKAGKEAYEAAKQQNIALAEEKFKVARSKLQDTQNRLKILSWTTFIPGLGVYYKDADHLVKSGFYSLDMIDIVIASVKPYADLLGLKGQGSFVGGSAEDRINKAVETLDKVTPNLGKLAEKMKLLRGEIDQVDPNRYPEKIKGTIIKSQLTQLKDVVDQGDKALSDARPFLEVLPSLLGQPTEQKYLILFQNDKELRSTGGFITAYAVLRLEKGKINVESSDDIYKLDDQKTKRVSAPTPILKYLPLVPYWNLRDINISPDFYVAMVNFEDLYNSIPGRAKISGIVAIDTQFLIKVMDVLGPIPVYGTEFTTKNVPECNCPQVIFELESFADKPVNYAKGSRKDIIGALMNSIMHKALSSSPKLYWGPLFQAGLTALNEKHVLVFLKDEKAQKAVEALNIGGRLREYDGDYFHLNDTNFAGAKSNMYVTEKVEQKIEIANDGTVTKTITVDYKNPQPPSDCNLEHGGLCLNGLLRDWIRFYVPKGSQLVESRGSEVKMTTGEDLGKTVFEGFLTVRPLGSSELVIKYQLAQKYSAKEYKLLIQKQPGTDSNDYVVILNGKKLEQFKLISDKELKIKT
ncbi:DUF4012 domain-containing protein [Candidatus Gottesmanbacteria bacterium]|nr:DUF4012 domain-containing protein [Candidatus Gottesmanbacteria bacterium]